MLNFLNLQENLTSKTAWNSLLGENRSRNIQLCQRDRAKRGRSEKIAHRVLGLGRGFEFGAKTNVTRTQRLICWRVMVVLSLLWKKFRERRIRKGYFSLDRKKDGMKDGNLKKNRKSRRFRKLYPFMKKRSRKLELYLMNI